MKTQIKGRNVTVTDALQDYAEEKIARVHKLLQERKIDEVTRVELELKVHKNPSIAEPCMAEATIFTRGPVIRAHESSTDMYAAIDLVTDKLMRRVKKYHDKVHGKTRKGHEKLARRRSSSPAIDGVAAARAGRRHGAGLTEPRRRTAAWSRPSSSRSSRCRSRRRRCSSSSRARLLRVHQRRDQPHQRAVPAQRRPLRADRAGRELTDRTAAAGPATVSRGPAAHRSGVAPRAVRRVLCDNEADTVTLPAEEQYHMMKHRRQAAARRRGPAAEALEEQVRSVNGFEPEVAALSDESCAPRPSSSASGTRTASCSTTSSSKCSPSRGRRAKRALGMRPFDVQVMGGIVLHDGDIAEMKTGEGKTLVATMPMYLNGLAGSGAHLVTVNDYLAKRDAEWMGQVYRFLGLEVGCHPGDDGPADARREQYNADVTYGTNSEFGFDYLRDNMAMRREHMVQRGHYYCIVDEVDSILIDEARTPLIISGAPETAADTYRQFARVVPRLMPERGLRGRREAAHGGGHRGGRRQGRARARHRQPLQGLQRRPGQPPDPGAARRGALPEGRRVRRPERRGAHRRRVHRPHPRGPALLAKAFTRPSRPRRRCRSAKRTRRSPPSPCRTTSACTRCWPA